MVRALRDAAVLYASWGWAVHPLIPRSKRPATKNGKNDATSDPVQVLRWWEQRDYNIGINCEASGLVVIDVDPRNGGEDTLYDLEKVLGVLGGNTLFALTGGGGWHFFFEHPGVPLRGVLADGVDIKDAGYVVAPPSLHPSGKRYEWEVGCEPGQVNLQKLPPAWLARMSRQSHVSAPLAPSDAPLLQIPSREYVQVLTGRIADRDGWVQCPWHKDGKERTPSMKLEGTMWSCYVCQPINGKRVCGGNIVSFAGKLWGYAMPLGTLDAQEVMDRLHGTFEPL